MDVLGSLPARSAHIRNEGPLRREGRVFPGSIEGDGTRDAELPTFEIHYGGDVAGLVDDVGFELEDDLGLPEVRSVVDGGDPAGDHLHPMAYMDDHPLLERGRPVLDEGDLPLDAAGHLHGMVGRDDESPVQLVGFDPAEG